MAKDWSEYATLYKAEKEAYQAYVDACHPPDGAHVRPTKVKEAQRAWYAALDARYILERTIAAELGIKRYEVPMQFLAETTRKKDAKR